ncbi:hypothetical protein Pedsa_2894 [Pseudopedobacter saltans DSM 12145]|uniref:DUF4397 domain-containing protein n=1 Tax=Pseudopedobacter saltans (strain ATCC 51119 / DSM 12145 / JCM 21818 / CCUG 39354 / LMG 10337 / NBRC 100064 / NCIMB 13643) TaxID=762903 RepID=F0S8G9_PSESL|nr:DUF4397 domain-containing protein [Pseudopedobacter saltans]ADY53433.1 hypothetical protein Pedsa_2894 [Pseudopedobacter saltans DSM 12145]
MNYLKAFTKGALLVAATISLSSCLKNKGNDYVQPDISLVSIYHASPGTSTFDFGIDGYKVDYGFKYKDRAGYYQLYTGTRNIAFIKENGTSLADSIRTTSIAVKKDSIYSLFLIGPSTAPETLLISDRLANPASGKANIRFINLSPDGGNFTLKAVAGTTDTTLVENVAYKKATAFSSVFPKTYKFSIYKGGNLITNTLDISITAGKNYTIWASGLTNATGSQVITLNVDENNSILQKKE